MINGNGCACAGVRWGEQRPSGWMPYQLSVLRNTPAECHGLNRRVANIVGEIIAQATSLIQLCLT